MKNLQSTIDIIQEFVNNYASYHKNEFERKYESLNESIKIICNKAPEGFIELARFGWYLGLDSLPKTPVELGEKLKNGLENEVDHFLIEYYEEHLDYIEDKLCKKNPHRKTIIREAFKNHKQKNYYSSISLLLTQADGLCYDKTKKLYFKNNGKLQKNKIYKPEVEEAIYEKMTGIMNLFTSPLKQPNALNEHTAKIDNFPIRLNRHEILHGIDYQYGSYKNSLKIISFLNYINDILDN